MPKPRLLIIGLDCAEPTLLEHWRSDLPNLDAPIARGAYGRLGRRVPAPTEPAWAACSAGAARASWAATASAKVRGSAVGTGGGAGLFVRENDTGR